MKCIRNSSRHSASICINVVLLSMTCYFCQNKVIYLGTTKLGLFVYKYSAKYLNWKKFLLVMLSIIGLTCLRRWHFPCCDLSLRHLDFKMEVFGAESTHVICPRAFTGILRSPYELRPVSVSHRAEALRRSDGRRPMYMSLWNILIFADTRTMNPMSGDRRAITVRWSSDLFTISIRFLPGPDVG